MVQRPVLWAVLVGLTALAIVVLFSRRAPPPVRARVDVPVVLDASVVPDASVAPEVATAPAGATPALAWPASAKYVLHVGDTSLGFDQGLALEMKRRFEAAGVRYESVTEIDAGLHTFAVSRKLESLLRGKKPDVVLLTLGMNNLTAARPEDVKSIVAQVGDRPCWWIGPLSIGRPETGLVALLARTTAPCGWTNSYDLVIERQPDHLHPTQPGASHWADAIWLSLGAP
jgi:lysophospholipase L1-like esterase